MGKIQEESATVHKNQKLIHPDNAPTQVHQKSTKIMFLFVKGTYTHALLLSVLVQVGEPNKSGGLNQSTAGKG